MGNQAPSPSVPPVPPDTRRSKTDWERNLDIVIDRFCYYEDTGMNAHDATFIDGISIVDAIRNLIVIAEKGKVRSTPELTTLIEAFILNQLIPLKEGMLKQPGNTEEWIKAFMTSDDGIDAMTSMIDELVRVIRETGSPFIDVNLRV